MINETMMIEGDLWKRLAFEGALGEIEGFRVEEQRTLGRHRWHEVIDMVVSRENEWLVRSYWRGVFLKGLTELQEHEGFDHPVTLERVYPQSEVVTKTVRVWRTGEELADVQR